MIPELKKRLQFTRAMATPTSKEIKQRVEDNFVRFVSDIDCNALSDWLIADGIMSTEQWEQIQNTNHTSRCRNRALMTWLLNTAHPNAFAVLHEFLESGKHWLLECIDPPTKPVVPSNDEIKARVTANYQVFLSDIDAEALSDWLRQERVLTPDKLRDIKSQESTTQGRNQALLGCLFDSSDPNAFTVLRKALEWENHWLLNCIDIPVQSPAEELPEISAQDDLLAKIERLQAENEKLRKRLQEVQENLRRERELAKGNKRKERTLSLKERQLTMELSRSEKHIQRNKQELQSLEGELAQRRSLSFASPLSDEANVSGSSGRGERALATQIVGQDCSSFVLVRCRSLDVVPVQDLNRKTDRLEALNQNNEAKRNELEMSRLNLDPTQKAPLIVETTGYSCKGKLCELRIRREFPGYGFRVESERSGQQFYSHKVINIERKSPAQRSGLKLGDLIVEINGVSVVRNTNKEAIKAMRKSPLRLTLLLVDAKAVKVLPEDVVDVSNVAVTPNIVRSASSLLTEDPVFIQTIQTERGDKLICGIATLDNELYIVTEDSTEVEIYDSVTCCFVRRWTLEELVAPWDISSCNRNKCLYIMNSENANQADHILRVAPNGILINSFSTGDDFAQSLSVTDESNVVLTFCDKNKLNEYTSNGQIIREIKLATGVTHPWHCLKLPTGQYAVCHGDYNGGLQRVCIVNVEGSIVSSFGDRVSSPVGQMNCPLYLAVDENGFIIVTDYGNGRVLLLNSDLTVARVLLGEKHGLRLPWRIHLIASIHRLYVSDSDYSYEKQQNVDSRLLVFEVR